MNRSNGTTPTSGYVYAIDCGDKVKIGCSTQPEERIHNLTKILGLVNPDSYISKKCFEHYCFEKEVHSIIGEKSPTGEFFSVSLSDAINVIEATVIEITIDQVNFINESKLKKAVALEKMSNDLLCVEYTRNLEAANKEAYSAVLRDAISWTDSFGLDHTDKLKDCNGCLVSLMAESLQIHKAVISEYAKAIKEIK